MAGQSSHEHEPVLVEPVRRLLELKSGEVVLDGTVGLGGHAAALLPQIAPDGVYIAIDVDAAMLALARARVEPAPAAVRWFEASYADFPEALEAVGVAQVDAMLLDLGINSAQLDDPARGFSFDQEGPLDMRFDQKQRESAIDLVNRLSESDLADLFYEHGQERFSRRIAKRICQFRHQKRIMTTRQLADAVVSALGPLAGQSKTHPATRVFQALRIAVNHELENLARFLERAPRHLRPGGRLAVISFHSLEDGIVKRAFREGRSAGVWDELTKRPVVAEGDERDRNPRSRSAKLRVARRLA